MIQAQPALRYDFHQWCGLPFHMRGRGPTHFVCWELIRAVLLDAKRISLPALLDDGEPIDQEAMANLERWTLIEMTIPQPFDILHFRMAYQGAHLGLAVNGSNFLHRMRGDVSRIDKLRSPSWECKLQGIYRYQP